MTLKITENTNFFCHLIFSTKYRRSFLDHSKIRQSLNPIIDSCQKDFRIMQYETDKDHIHFLIYYDSKISVIQIVRHLKQITTVNLRKVHRDVLRKMYWNEKNLVGRWLFCMLYREF